MGRPRQFDEQAVLAKATQCFWMHGYEATSVRHLAEWTGLTTASLYNAFGDKRALYRRVLDGYASAALDACAEAFGCPTPPIEAIERFFQAIVAEALSDPQRRGCLVVNSALETAPHDEEFRAVVAEVFIRIEEHLRGCLARGQADRTISTAQSADDLARTLLGVFLGLRVLARTRPDPELLSGLMRSLSLILQPH